MRIEKENKWNTESNMVNNENSFTAFEHFETMLFMHTQKAVYCHLPWSRGVIKRAIGIHIKMPSWEQISLSQL